MGEKKDSEAGIIFLIMMIIGLILAAIGLTFYVTGLKKENVKLSDAATSNTNNEVVTPVYDEEEKEVEITVDGEEDDEELVEEQESTENKNEFSNVEVKECLQNYLGLVGVMHGSTEGLLRKLGYTDFDESSLPDYFTKTNIKYSDFKNKMLNYMTEECFNNSNGLNEYFKEKDEYLIYSNVGASGWGFEIENVQLVEDLKYTAIVNYGEERQNQKEINFSLEEINGKLVIATCDFDFMG